LKLNAGGAVLPLLYQKQELGVESLTSFRRQLPETGRNSAHLFSLFGSISDFPSYFPRDNAIPLRPAAARR